MGNFCKKVFKTISGWDFENWIGCIASKLFMPLLMYSHGYLFMSGILLDVFVPHYQLLETLCQLTLSTYFSKSLWYLYTHCNKLWLIIVTFWCTQARSFDLFYLFIFCFVLGGTIIFSMQLYFVHDLCGLSCPSKCSDSFKVQSANVVYGEKHN